MRLLLGPLLAAALAAAAAAQTIPEQDGWRVITTEAAYADLLAALKSAVEAEGMAVVTEAGPTEAAAARGESIPGNRVVGVFRNDFAVTMIRAAPAAMIEAPVRFMVHEEPGGGATLAYKLPSAVFAPYAPGAGAAFAAATEELDAIFARIADTAVAEVD